MNKKRVTTMKNRNPRDIRIREADGSSAPFDLGELRTQLDATFVSAGRAAERYLAEDIAVAVAYTLEQLPRPEPVVVSRGELDAAVLRAIEDNGFPEVARAFRAGGTVESSLETTDDGATLAALLKRFFRGADEERFAQVLSEVRNAAKLLNLGSASPQLWLELARHYDRRIAEKRKLAAAEEPLPLPVTLTESALSQLLPETVRKWVDAGVLKISGVTSLFPSIHFFFMMRAFAAYHHLSGTITELELEPLLYRAGAVLEELRRRIGSAIDRNGEALPCLITVPDIFDFIAEYAGGERLGTGSLAAELAGALTSGLPRDHYKLSLE